MPTPALDLIVNINDRNLKGLCSLSGGQVTAGGKLPDLVRYDGKPFTLRFVKPNQTGNRAFDDVDVSLATVRVGVGLPDQVPTDGTFYCQVGSDITADLPYNATAAVVQAALNLLPGVIVDGGVTVTNPLPGLYQVKWNVAGTQGSIPAILTRSSVASIYFLPNVTGYTGGGSTNLDGTATVGTSINSLFIAIIGGVASQWQLQAGTGTNDIPAGVIRPTDYNVVTNAVNFVRVEGI